MSSVAGAPGARAHLFDCRTGRWVVGGGRSRELGLLLPLHVFFGSCRFSGGLLRSVLLAARCTGVWGVQWRGRMWVTVSWERGASMWGSLWPSTCEVSGPEILKAEGGASSFFAGLLNSSEVSHFYLLEIFSFVGFFFLFLQSCKGYRSSMNLIIIVTSDSFPVFGVTAAQLGGCFPEWTRWVSSRAFPSALVRSEPCALTIWMSCWCHSTLGSALPAPALLLLASDQPAWWGRAALGSLWSVPTPALEDSFQGPASWQSHRPVVWGSSFTPTSLKTF